MSRYIGNTANAQIAQQTQASAGGVYTLKDQLVYNAREQWPVGRDPYFNYTTLLLQGDVPYTRGRNAMTLPLAYNSDASTNNFLITPNGDVGPRPFSPYFGGNYSVYFGSGNYLSAASNAAFAPGTGDFTVEAWVYPDSAYTTFNYILGVAVTNGLVFYITGGNLVVRAYGSSDLLSSSTIPALNTWTHVAATRSGTTLRIFVNGVLTASTANSTNFAQAAAYIGNDSTNQAPWYGYISNFRFVKGTAVYTSNFTPSLTPLQNISGTSLLACQANRFIDNSTANSGLGWALTVTGTPRITDNSPFVSTDSTSGSAYFDGSGDSLSNIGTTTSFNVLHQGTPKFTIEAYVYVTTTISNYMVIFDNSGFGSTGHGITFDINNSGYLNLFIVIGASGSWVINSASTTVVPTNQWVHVAATYDHSLASNNLTFYINGTSAGSFTKTANSPSSSNASYAGRIGSDQAGNYAFQGYISNLRITNTVASAPLLPTQSLTANSNTLLLTLQTRAPSQNINFIDSSPNEFLITRSGNTTQGTFSPFSPTGWSNYFDGTNDNISVSSSTDLAAGTGAFTIEMWVFTADTVAMFCASQTVGGLGFGYNIDNSSQGLWLGRVGQGVDATSGVQLPYNQWNHIAVTRDGSNNVKFFVNGTQSGSTQNVTTNYGTSAQGLYIAADQNGVNNPYGGYISNLRYIKGQSILGTATSFTVPASPLTATSVGWTGTNVATSITGTVSLLTCQSNRFVDNSSNPKTLTPNNGPSVQAFSPFPPANAVSPLVTGGSGYFDGTGDYLSITTTSADFNLTGDFTIEFYANPDTQTNSYPSILACASAWSAGAFYVRYSDTQTANKFAVFLNPSDPLITASITSAVGSWHHVAVTRSGSNIILWVNGLNVGNATNSTTINLALGGGVWIGNNGSTSCFYKGYTSNLRVIKGTALYTANFTPPTTPLTAVPNTSLLLNFTNGAAVDATGRAVFESVGGVFSTRAQAKFDPLIGGSSIYFNGTANTRLQTSSSSSPTLLNMGTGDYTVECWIRPVGTPASQQCIWDFRATDVSGQGVALNWTPSRTIFLYYLATRITSSPITTDTWHHTAVVRANGVYSLYIDGALVGTYNNSDTVAPAANRPYLGAVGDGSQVYNGYIDNFRMTRYARYLTGTGANANQMVFNGTNVLALPTAPFPRG